VNVQRKNVRDLGQMSGMDRDGVEELLPPPSKMSLAIPTQ